MRKNAQQTGMQGVFLAAAQLAGRGLIVSPTSRSAKGADLLVTDQECARAWSVQVKTNSANTSYWLVGEHAKALTSDSHVYVLVNLRKNVTDAEYFVVPSRELAGLVDTDKHDRSTWWYVDRKKVASYLDGWGLFSAQEEKPVTSGLSNAQLILYVAEQASSTTFYSAVLGTPPRLNIPGMTEFDLPGGAVLGLMPDAGIRRLLEPALPDPSAGRGIPRAELYLVVDDPDRYFARALAAGARELSPLGPRDWGHEVAYCLDPDSHVLAFAREHTPGDHPVP